MIVYNITFYQKHVQAGGPGYPLIERVLGLQMAHMYPCWHVLYENILLFDAHADVYRNTHPKMCPFWGPLKCTSDHGSDFRGFGGEWGWRW